MRIGQRLFLAVAPGIVGVIVLAALAYWGERGRQVPEVFLAIAAVVTAVSLWLAWSVTRDVAKRVARLGRLVDARQGRDTELEPTLLAALAREALARLSGTGKAHADELDAVERLVARVDGELERLGDKVRAADARAADARAEAARLLHDAGSRIAQRLNDVRLPLHVLLEAPFGELNENQEELIGAARAAADDASAEARRLGELGALELTADGARRDRIAPADVLRALEPMLQAEARRARVRITLDLAPALPAVAGDRTLLPQAVRDVLARVVRAARPEAVLTVSASEDATNVRIAIAPVGGIDRSEFVTERRTLEALGGSLVLDAASAQISLPRWTRL